MIIHGAITYQRFQTILACLIAHVFSFSLST